MFSLEVGTLGMVGKTVEDEGTATEGNACGVEVREAIGILLVLSGEKVMHPPHYEEKNDKKLQKK